MSRVELTYSQTLHTPLSIALFMDDETEERERKPDGFNEEKLGFGMIKKRWEKQRARDGEQEGE